MDQKAPIFSTLGCRLNAYESEAMRELADAAGLGDAVIVNTCAVTSEAVRKSQKEIRKALFQYERLAKMGEQLTAPNGVLVLASCSSRISAHDFYEVNIQVISASGRFVQLIDQTQHDVDHPIGFEEGAYLKCGYYQFFD